jgi:hypothetical protein
MPDGPVPDLAAALAGHLPADPPAPSAGCLAVIDGVVSICALMGMDPNDAVDVARFHQAITDPLVDLGFTVLLTLPTGKPRDDRPVRGPAGSVEWAHRADVVLQLDPVNGQGIRPGATGVVQLKVTKDRHGGLMRLCEDGGAPVGSFKLADQKGKPDGPIDAQMIAPSGSGSLAAALVPKPDPDSETRNKIRTVLSRGTRKNATALREAVRGRAERVAAVRDAMVRTGELLSEPHGNGALYWLAPKFVPESRTVPGTEGTGNEVAAGVRSVPGPPSDRGTGTDVLEEQSAEAGNEPGPAADYEDELALAGPPSADGRPADDAKRRTYENRRLETRDPDEPGPAEIWERIDPGAILAGLQL